MIHRGAEMGKFINFIACEGQSIMPDGYSPIPPNLVQEDFWAIARITGGVEPPAPAANCKNPYVDGQIPLLGEPVIQGAPAPEAGGGNTGAGGGAAGSGAHGAAAAGAAGGTAGSGTGGNGATSGTYGTSGATGGSSPLAVAQACQNLSKSNKALSPAGLFRQRGAKAGFAFVDGQVVRILPDGAEQALRDGSILAASHLVLGPRALELVFWLLLGLAVVLGPPVYMIERNRRRKATVPVSGSRPRHGRRRGGGADL